MNILSIGFHYGALVAIEDMLKNFGTSENIYAVNSELLPIDASGYHYNMTEERANSLWKEHQDFYNQYDVIITSDTAPLSRIFLQNRYKGKLIVYVCNRFDYCDGNKTDAFPDSGYYDMLRDAMSNENVALIGYTPYEQIYCNRHGIYLEDIIKPALDPLWESREKNGYYIPAYQNNENFKLAERCKMDVLTGRHGGIRHLATFKAVIHLPYHWNGIANSEALSVHTPYYVPTKRFLLELVKEPGYWFQNYQDLPAWIDLCDFYDKRLSPWLFYFDSWDDIGEIEPEYELIRDLASSVYVDSRRRLTNVFKRWM